MAIRIIYIWFVSFLFECSFGLQGCNQTIEAIQGSSKLVRSPYINYESLGKSLVCWYNIRIKPSLLELNIEVDFDSFNVGKLVDNNCLGGHIQVLDSKYEAVNDELGYHCGEIRQPKKIISALSKEDLPERYGSHPQFFPGKVGAIVDGTYCETVFQDCREQNCYVQSPGFPGVYPRGVSCRYYLSTKAPLIRMYTEGLYWNSFNVDARRCEGYFGCDFRQLSDECPYDYVSVYDGLDEYSPLIAKFCGTGVFPRSIIGTSNRMFVEFISSRHGPLQNTGFDFKITSSPSPEKIYNRTCNQVIQSGQLNGKGEGTLLSIEHWYKPGTNCTYLLQGSATQVVRLYFMKMKINNRDYIKESNETCGEYLVIYDSFWPDPNKIIKAFCNTLAISEQRVDYISTGPHMLVNFVSNTGSYAGSSIYYWAIFDFHETESEGEKVGNTLCDEVFTRKVGRINSPRNTLIYSNPNKDRIL